MSAGLLGFGSALPELVRTNDFWNGRLHARDEKKPHRDMLALERSSRGETTSLAPEIAEAIADLRDDSPFRGAKLRRVVTEGETSSDLEARALRAALADAGVAPERVDLLIVSSILPDFINPMNGPALQHKCGLSNAAAWSVEAACASLPVQLLTAASLVEQGAFETIAIVQSHVASPILDLTDPISPGFGDGAAAALVGRVPDGYGLLGHYMKTDGRYREGIVFVPAREGRPERKWWEACDEPWSIRTFALDMAKASGMKAVDFCREASTGALQRAGLAIDDVSLFLCNQSVSWFVGACRRGLGLPADKALSSFEEVANIGAAAILHNLSIVRKQGRVQAGDVILMYAPAAGFTRTAVVYRHWGGGQ
jgi:3-oxoacyl-[acyl-carrier-protein] synthase III